MRSVGLAFAVVLLLATAVSVNRYHHDLQRWEPDAAIYLRMTLEDRGLTRDAARAEANRFMVTTSEGTNADSRGFYGATPPDYYARQAALFKARPLFPFVASLLYPRLGPHGLQAISAVSYVLATGLMFVVLLSVAPPWLAAIGGVAFAATPAVLGIATYGMTDELALVFWIAALGAIAAYARAPSAALLAAVIAASAALAFTRPAIYLPVGAALGALAAVRFGTVTRRAALALVAATVAVAVAYVVYAAAAGGPGLREQLAWQFEFARATGAPAQSFAAWYVRAELTAIAKLVVHEVVANAGVFTLLLAAIGLSLPLRRGLRPVLVGAAAATAVAIAANPLEFARTVELPLTPVITILATAALAAVAARLRPARSLP